MLKVMTHVPIVPSTERRSVRRRRFLQAGAVTTASIVLAGCLGDDSTDDGTDDEAAANSEPDADADVPADFADRSKQREHARQFIDLLADEQYEVASQWFDEEEFPVRATDVENIWTATVEDSAGVDSVQTVAYSANIIGIDSYTVRARISGDEFEISIGFTANGIAIFDVLELTEWSRPAYIDPSAFTTEELALETPLDCELGATLTVPETDEQVPGMVLVHGNGPHDRDTAIGPNRPFKELAQGLASEGIAVLRYDKRSFACELDHADLSIDDIVTDDAVTALSRLREHEQVDDSQLWVAGHSFGGNLAPRIAEMDGDIAGTVLLAPGPARPIEEMIRDQVEHQLELQEATGPLREELLDDIDTEAEKIRTLDIDDDEVVRFGGREFHESLQEYEPIETAQSLDIPQLLIQGGQDWQVTTEADLPIWEEGLEDESSVEITVYDDLNHMFQQSEGQRTQQEYFEPESPVDERVIDEIVSFVDEYGEVTQQAVPLVA